MLIKEVNKGMYLTYFFIFRCMELALIHDLAECIVGDITPYCGVTIEEKHKREREAMAELAQLAGSSGSYLLQVYEVNCFNYYN